MSHESAVLQAIHHRRSIRRFKPEPIPRHIVKQILQAATWAPSAHNRQPWRFAVLDQSEDKERLAAKMGRKLRNDLEADGVPEEMIRKDTERSYERMTSAPVLIVVCMSLADMDTYPDAVRSRNEWVMAIQSTAMAGQNLLLSAHDMGLGACWMCAPLFSPEVVMECLQLPTDWQPQGLVVMGYPAQARTKERRPVDEMTIWY